MGAETKKVHSWSCKCGAPSSLFCGATTKAKIDALYADGDYLLCSACTSAHQVANKFVPRKSQVVDGESD